MRTCLAALALAAAIPACGGGGGGSGGSGPGSLKPGLSPNTTPSAALAGSQSSAAALAAEIQDGATQLVKAATNGQTSLPGATVPGGVQETVQCSQLGGGTGSGSASVDTNASSSGPAAGTTISITYSDCTIMTTGVTETINGTLQEEYTRYNSATDFQIVLAANLTVSVMGTGVSENATVDFTETLDESNGTITVSYTAANGGSLVITASAVTHNGTQYTISNASYVYTSAAGGGVVKAVYNNWTYDTATGHPVSGTVTITGANGATAVITATATGYTIVYTSASGAMSTYTVTYS